MGWWYLFVAGILEASWVVGMKYTEGFTKLIPSVLTIAAMAISLYLLSQAVRTIPLGTGYAVWTGIGVVGAAIFGILVFKEPIDWIRALCLISILAGIAGLRLLTR